MYIWEGGRRDEDIYAMLRIMKNGYDRIRQFIHRLTQLYSHSN